MSKVSDSEEVSDLFCSETLDSSNDNKTWSDSQPRLTTNQSRTVNIRKTGQPLEDEGSSQQSTQDKQDMIDEDSFPHSLDLVDPEEVCFHWLATGQYSKEDQSHDQLVPCDEPSPITSDSDEKDLFADDLDSTVWYDGLLSGSDDQDTESCQPESPRGMESCNGLDQHVPSVVIEE